MSAEITFYSAWYCPFAQRTWTALEYLGLPYVYEETDPYHKSDRWMELSRGTGQVPVLQIQARDQTEMRIPDSLRTLEYLDEVQHSSGALFPLATSERVEARLWLDHQGKAIIPYFYRFLKAENESAAANLARNKMMAGLNAFTGAMSVSGPYFFSDQPGVVDFGFAPFALRIKILLSRYKDFHLPRSGENWSRYQTWWRAMQSHPSFVNTMPQRDTYQARLLEFYLPYSQGGGQTDVTEAA